MRICLYTCSALPKVGGQELVIDSLARQFLAMGHEPTVLAPASQFFSRSFDAKLPYRMLRHPRFVSTHLFTSAYRYFLTRAHQKYQFEILHCHDVHPSAYIAALLKPQNKIPLVITSHGGDVKENNVRLSKPGLPGRYVFALKRADAIVSIGKFTEESIRRICPDIGRMQYIPNGVDFRSLQARVDRPASIDASIAPEKYIFFIGRLKSRKGVDVLINAISRLPKSSDCTVVIAGSGEEETSLRSQVSQLGLESRIRFVGRVAGDAKTWLLQNALCVVIPSRDWEAFPLVVLESYAAGKAVIASNIPGLRDLVEEGQTGRLVAPEAPAALAAAMSSAFENRDETKRIGQIAHARAAAYDWPTVAQQHIDLYRSLIK